MPRTQRSKAEVDKLMIGGGGSRTSTYTKAATGAPVKKKKAKKTRKDLMDAQEKGEPGSRVDSLTIKKKKKN